MIKAKLQWLVKEVKEWGGDPVAKGGKIEDSKVDEMVLVRLLLLYQVQILNCVWYFILVI